MNYKCRILFAAHRQSASLQLTFALNANTACRGYRSFLCPRTRASTAVVSRYTAIVMCALHCRSLLYSTRTPPVAVIVLFLCPRTRASTAVVSRYTAIVMCALAHFLAAHFCTQREHRLSRLSFFFYVHALVQARGGVSIYRYRNVRFCALPLPLTFVLNANNACRGYRSFFMSTHPCKHGGWHKKEHSHK